MSDHQDYVRRIYFNRVFSDTILRTGQTQPLTLTIAMAVTEVWTTDNLKDRLTGEHHLKRFVLV